MKTIVSLAALCCFGLALAMPVGTTALSEEEAASVSGAVRIDGRSCKRATADCNLYNQSNGIVFPCPTGSGLCSECEINDGWDTCVQATSTSACNWLGNGNKCGALLRGACDGAECILLTPLSVCIRAPKCL
jgi:hypothetical protein